MSSLIIFDCDGVLVDSETIAHKVTLESFKELDYSITLEECIKKFTGVSDLYVRDLILQERGLSIPKDFFDITQLKIIEAFKSQLKPFMIPILSHLQNNNIERCVASSSIPQRVKYSLEITG